MQERDGRSIPDAALEVLRERAVAMHEAGSTARAIASALGVPKNTVGPSLAEGLAASPAQQRSRPKSAAAATRPSGCWTPSGPPRCNS